MLKSLQFQNLSAVKLHGRKICMIEDSHVRVRYVDKMTKILQTFIPKFFITWWNFNRAFGIEQYCTTVNERFLRQNYKSTFFLFEQQHFYSSTIIQPKSAGNLA